MTDWPPPLAKRDEKYRKEILERIEEGWQVEEWATSILQRVNELLLWNLFETGTPQATRKEECYQCLEWKS